MVGEKWLPPPRKMSPPVATSSFENMKVMQRFLKKKMRLSKTSLKLHSIFWLQCKISKYLQHCVRMIHILKTIVYSLPTCLPLIIPSKFHFIFYWNNWLRFYLYLNCMSVRNYEMANINKIQIWWKLVTMLCYAYKICKK